MATDYNDYIQLANELIAENGRSVTFQKLSSTPVDPAKPWKGAGTPTVTQSKEVAAVFVPAQGASLGRDIVNEELLSRVDQVAIVAPTDVPLHNFNVVIDEGVRWNVNWVQELKPGSLTVLYVFGVNR